jgi:cellulose biosynthesis protein BcsQ
MSISFSETFAIVRECLNNSNIVVNLENITIIRDIYGKIRLFIEPKNNNKLDESEIKKVEDALRKKLSPYYDNDLWFPQGQQDPYQALIEKIINERKPTLWDDESSQPRWYILERHLAKQAWTEEKLQEPPWESKHVEQGYKPAIISFFSFKGGVGRTTTLAATALTLARQGLKIAMVDLDLEAPGLTTLFSDNTYDFGVIDYLLEKKVQGEAWKLKTHIANINDNNLFGNKGGYLQLLPAGKVDDNYLEKLARLDLQNLVNGELPKTMQGMFRELQSIFTKLDFILVDARAGFHDLGGLAIANLSHGVVIFGTQSRQSWAGLTQVIRLLAPEKGENSSALILVQAMTPALSSPGRNEELKLFREKAYTIFQENYYSVKDTVPNENDTEAPFQPFTLPYNDNLRGDIKLFFTSDTPEEKDRLNNVVRIMTDNPYKDIAQKLCESFARPFS